MKYILVTGGAGYIGSHVNELLNRKGYKSIVFDSLERGNRDAVKWGSFIQGNLSNKNEIEQVFKKYSINTVIHLAAYAYVGESVEEPERYYCNNVCNTINLLAIMKKYNCNKIVFSSTCATYGEAEGIPITEEMTQHPINPYGATKLIVEGILKDYSRAYGLQYVILRYFNAAGANPEGIIGECHNPETHLIPLVLDAASGKKKVITVFGTDYDTCDGSCIRDYIHVSDLAYAHYLALKYLNNNGKSDSFNLGNMKGTSVLEVIDAVKKVTGKEVKIIYEPRREGDPAVLVGSSKKARQVLGWKPEHEDIETIVGHAWKWQEKRGIYGSRSK